jgi:uncharacterized membrane protein YeiB
MGGFRDRGRQIALIAGGVVALGLVIWLIVWISVQGAWPTVRDIMLVVLAVVTLVPLLALTYAVLELVRTARTVAKELIPVLDELKETTHSVRKTAEVANNLTVKPAVRTASFLVGFSQAASVMMGQGNARRRQTERRRRAAQAETDASQAAAPETEANHAAPR